MGLEERIIIEVYIMFDRQKSRTIKDPIEVSAPSSQARAKEPSPDL